jgi:ElaB/YqjD/DUF883 family membrane-anchored ribosome-binding protein
MARARMNDDTALDAARDAGNDVSERAGATGETLVRGATEAGRKVADEAGEAAASVQEKLKAVGVDTDVMMHAARDQAGELQKLVADELRTRPLRALGFAAAAGLIVGYLSAR